MSAPADPAQEPQSSARTPRWTSRQVRDLLSVLLVVLGAVGLAVVAWEYEPLAGAALLSAYAIIVGVLLGLDS